MRKRRTSHGTVTERMREQIAMKRLKAEARARGLDVETYMAQVAEERERRAENDRMHRLSETLAERIAERVKLLAVAPAGESAEPEEPAPPPRIPFDDLQGIVDHLLQKKSPA